MSLTYVSSTGEIFGPSGKLLAIGYSGYGPGKNDPYLQSIRGTGPIPTGLWKLTDMYLMTDTHGPYVIRLEPEEGTEVYGRSGFLIHGDSIQRPGMGSHGCIVLPRVAREAVWKCGDRYLVVVARVAPPPNV